MWRRFPLPVWAKKNSVRALPTSNWFHKTPLLFCYRHFDFPNSCIRRPTKTDGERDRAAFTCCSMRVKLQQVGNELFGGGGEDSEKKVGNNGTTRRSRPDCCSLCLGCYTNSRGGLANVNRVSTFFSSIRRMFNLIVQHRKLNFDWNLKESNWFLERKPSQNLSHEWLFTFCFSFFFGKCSLTLNKQVLFSKQKTMEGQLNF